MDIAIAGAGIAGLTAALALSRKGFRVRIFERAPRLEEVGAAIQLSPNAVHCLRLLDLEPAAAAHADAPQCILVGDGRRDRVLNRIPLGDTINERHGAPYWTILRRDLQSVLLDAAKAHPQIEVALGAPIDDVGQAADNVSFAAGGGRHRADILIAADGVNSALRTALFAQPGPTPSGRTAWRATVAACNFERAGNGLWFAGGAHFVHYPVDNGATINLVLIAKPDPAHPDPPFGLFAPRLRAMMTNADWLPWPLLTVDPARPWANGRVALIGDAAHGMLPTLAQGGAQAIEDAIMLAAALALNIENPGQGLAAYAGMRSQRVRRVHTEAKRTASIYALSGPLALARNLAIAAMPEHAHLARLDWLYGWKPTAA